ncbi:MAG: hypothetical protein IH939_18640 [Acidobacteria bacterium]|nr:hypothetical protein [Acidobacteriota bacterium]
MITTIDGELGGGEFLMGTRWALAEQKRKVHRRRPQEFATPFYPANSRVAFAFKYFNHDDISMPAGGALLLWLACKDFPMVRETAIQMANDTNKIPSEGNPDQDLRTTMRAAQKLGRILREEVMASSIMELTRSLGPKQQLKVLQDAKKMLK